jgi:acid phosphatase (class A)
MLGYLFAFTLAQIIPKKQDEIQRRGEDYAQNRLICGVHYRSDLEASRLASATLFGYMLANSMNLNLRGGKSDDTSFAAAV